MQRLLLGVFFCALFAGNISTSNAKTLVLAQLSERPKKDFKELRPMVEYAANQLHHLGITKGKVKLFSKPEALVEALKQGEVHWVSETPYAAAILVKEANAEPILMKWKSGQPRYQSLIYTHKNSGLKDIKDLTGKRFGFEHDTSFSSYVLPRMLMEQQGLSFQAIDSPKQRLSKDKVNYLFSRNEKNNLLWVHKQIVDAGTLNNGDWNNPKRVPDALKDDLRIIYKSDFYPRALELVSSQLPPEQRKGLKNLLLNLTTEKNGALLYRYEKTTGFEEPQANLPQLLDDIYSYKQRYTQ